MDDVYEVFALKYAEHHSRTRAQAFLLEDDHATPFPIDYFVWVVTNGARTIVVDTGFEGTEAARRGRTLGAEPAAVLAAQGFAPEAIDTVIVSHLHFDHAGGLDAFPAATFHLQAAEMAFATGPCMCNPTMRTAFTVSHVTRMVEHVYSGRVIFHEGDAEVAPGVTVHRIGGHSRGLQSVRVMTRRGPVVLASDAAHVWEHLLTGKMFPVLADPEDVFRGYARLLSLAPSADHVIPGHDPLVTSLFPAVAEGAPAFRLDADPRRAVRELIG